ncbi:MAG: hypothetical protein ACOY0T_11500 [Myxococcota bacterium]
MAQVRSALVTALALAALCGGCSSEGETPKCPPLPLYDVRDESAREAVRPQLLAAKDCITLPVGLEGEGGASN